jgi:ubiquinone/menaquinone biosynthesis C-methylase UbiE
MPSNILTEIRQSLYPENPARLEYTRRAFEMLPRLDAPCILDIGCGAGEPTIELARLSQGKVVGLDMDQSSLDQLSVRAKATGLSDHIRIVKGSMFEMDFPGGSFDLIWSEGSIHVVGFRRGLRHWRRLLKSVGFLVVHEMAWLRPDPPQEIADHWRKVYPGIQTIAEHLEQIAPQGYELLGHFPVPEETWWRDYYRPLEERIRELQRKYAKDRAAQAILDREQREVDLYKKYSQWYGSAFFVMRKT